MTDDSLEGLNRERDEGDKGGSKVNSIIYLMQKFGVSCSLHSVTILF